ncbi:MAG TPA: CHAD domain-containing protein, partial [Spirochaetia bacterium]|nr:CHAD domain-containing protein [Spirochaetia bacterium]
MKTLALAPGKVGSLGTYLGYLFLRFPGTLGPEEPRTLECLDTYDRRWSRQGQIWVRDDSGMRLVAPPALVPLGTPESAFGLQAPVVVGRTVVTVRALRFEGEPPVEGQLVRAHRRTWLVLTGSDERWETLTTTLVREGLVPLVPGEGWWVTDKGPRFQPSPTWTTPGAGESAVAVLVDRVREGFRVARQYEKGIRDDVDTECLHQYRVHLRRVRSLVSLGTFWEVIPEARRLKAVLRTLQQKTNELRDADVLLLDLPALVAQVPWGEGPRLAGWRSHLEGARKAELRRVRAWLNSEEYLQSCAEVGRLLDDLTGLGEPWSAGDWAADALGRVSRGLKKRLRELPDDPADDQLHDLRIRAKRLRYALDALGSLGHRPSVKTLLGALRETQDSLGQF